MKKILAVLPLLLSGICFAQSYRGLSVLNDRTAWMSGSKGTVVRTTNGGESWDTLRPEDYSKKDFRDIHAWSDSVAIVMSAGDSAVVLKTADGGKTWKLVFESNREGVFLDAFDFNGQMGVMIGDPYFETTSAKYYFDLYFTSDGGENWLRSMEREAAKDDALFAASGTNILIRRRDKQTKLMIVEFVVGGNEHYLFSERVGKRMIPLKTGQACGPYSFAKYKRERVAVGGSYLLADSRDSTCAYWDRETKTWMLSKTMPGGYRSCVSFSLSGKKLACTGTNGTDVSTDGGKTWKKTSIAGYNCCAFSKKYLWLAGDKGRWQRVRIRNLR